MSLLLALLLAPQSAWAQPVPAAAPAALASTLDPEAPAADPAEDPSIWSYIETAEGAPPTRAQLAATEELVQERLAELGQLGAVGAEPPLEYYLDPIAATDGDPLHLDRVDPREFDIPVVVNDAVKGWMRYFLGRGRKYYTRYLERSTKWLPMMHRELDARGLPHDLVYLSMIESGFTTSATSYAAAAGLWQFMTYTGRDYGLRIDWWVDERRDPEAATKAALRYLSDLHKMFAGDWWLAWASYNGGQGRVLNATRRYGTTDFWKIAEGSYLHTETENYVPKLIAAAIIGKHPERYGFVGLDYQAAWTFDTVEVPGSTSVDVLAKCAGIGEDEFLEYNPAIRRFALPPDPEVQRVRIPAARAVAFKEAFAKVPPEERLQLTRHVVKRGESLGSIARKYGIGADEIARVNRIANVNRITVGMELTIPVRGKSLADVDAGATKKAEGETKAASAASAAPAAKAEKGATAKAETKAEAKAAPKTEPKTETKTVTHTVKSGETLSGLASKYGVTIKELQGWNKLSGTGIQAGQKLVVGKKEVAVAAASTGAATKAASASSGASSSAAKPSGKTTTYTVRRGDTLGSIADRYGCSVADLKSWNGLKGTTIYPGQKLKIRG